MTYPTTILTKTHCLKLAATILLSLATASAMAQSATYNEAYTIHGFSQPNRVSKVASSTPGIVHTLEVNEGEQVSHGKCLVRLDNRVHNQKLELARVAKDSQGDLETAQAELDAKNTRLTRLQALSSRSHATAVELMQAHEDVAIARANLQRAKDRNAQATAEYARLHAESEQHFITAPFDGVVVEFAKEVGEYVGPGDTVVCTFAELDTLSVEFLMPRQFRENFNLRDQVDVVFTVSGQTVTGTIQYISPFPNGETSTFMVKARVDNSAGKLSAGERCQLQIGSAKRIESASRRDSRLTARD
jgi:RND family efflux transporter MFP subunit